MFLLMKGHQPGVYVPLRALFLVLMVFGHSLSSFKTFLACSLSHV